MKKMFTSEFNGKVALELVREADTMATICSRHEVHPTQAGLWKQRLLKGAYELFGDKSSERKIEEQQKLIDELYGQIGQLKHEVAWLKKKL